MFKRPIARKAVLGLAVIVITALMIFLISFLSRRTASLPPEFVTAWQTASGLSGEITALTGDTNKLIQSVNISDLAGRPGEAPILIGQARQKNQNAYQKAFELSMALKKLAESLDKLPTMKNQQAAYEAVALELALISDFISYTQQLNKFLDSLAAAIMSGSNDARLDVARNLAEVNQKVISINKINGDFAAKIRKLDQSL